MKFGLYMNKACNIKKLLLSISAACLVSACASNSVAPVESTDLSQKKKYPNDSSDIPHISKRTYKSFKGYICEDAPVYINQVIGNGECVDLVKLCSNAPITRLWKPGDKVFGNDVPTGAAIATFRNGKYPNKTGWHAAIYSHQDKNGIYAWDQWQGKPVHLRYIQAHQSHKTAGNNASKYRIIDR